MRRNRFVKILAGVLSIVMTLSTVAGATVDNVVLFKDSNVNYLKYITGFGDGTVRPDTPLTRAQCAKMLTYIMDIKEVSEKNAFSDVPDSFWAYDSITKLNSAGIILGYADGKFKPNNNLTRAEFATIIRRITNLKDGKASFGDIATHWAKNDIAALAAAGYINGYSGNIFRPNATITRAEAVKIINKVVGMEVNKDENRLFFYDLTKEHWAYYEIMSAVSVSSPDSYISHPDIDFNEIEYIEIDTDQISNELERILDEFITASADRQAEIFNRISQIESEVALAIAMSNINIQRNVTSEKDIKNTQVAVDVSNLITKVKEKRYKFLSVVKDLKSFEEKIGMKISEIPKPAAATPDALVALYMKEQNYENEFNTFMYEAKIIHNGKKYSLSQGEFSSDPLLKAKALNYYVEHKNEYGMIFTKLVNVRTEIAQFFGYNDYTDLGYMRAGKNYYTPTQIEGIREDVKKYIAPLVVNIENAAMGNDNGYYNVNTPSRYISHNKSAISIAREFLRNLSPQTREAFDYLEKSNLIDYVPRENKSTIAFTSYITEYDVPFLFMNADGTAQDIENLSHEFGHAFHAFRIGEAGVFCPTDIAEIASYGMEMLALNNYNNIFGDESANKEKLINFYNKLRVLLTTTFMDEFQYKVYKEKTLGVDERNKLYAYLYKEYFPDANFNHKAYNDGIIWTNPTHIFNEPYYSIDYTLALTIAFQLWEIGEAEGFDKQFETYVKILESPYINTSIHKIALDIGMKSPFNAGIIQGLAKKIEDMYKTEYEKQQTH